MKRRIAVIALSLMMAVMVMVPTAFAADVEYKSSYVLAGFPSGAGSATRTGSDYGVFGGLILGDVSPSNIVYMGVSGEYDSDTGDYIVTYQIDFAERPTTTNNMFYVALSAPVGVTVYSRAPGASSNWWQHDSSSLYYFNSIKPVMAFDLSSYYPAETNCYAVGINSTCLIGLTARFQVRISDPLAVAQLEGSGNFLDTILYPFTVVSEHSVVVNFITSIWTTPLVSPFFTLALSALALGMIIKFMR